MKKIILILFCFISINLFSQDFSAKEQRRLNAVLKRSTSTIRGFDKTALISIEKTSYPEMEADIENALFTAGFKVVSNRVAKEAVTISNPLNPKNDTIEIAKTTTFKSVYVITVNGSFYQGALIGRCQEALLSFTARIVDLANDGGLVGTFKYTGNALTFVACVEDVANALVFRLKSPENNN